MNERIKNLSESPCTKCGCSLKCENKVERIPKLQEIQDYVFGRRNYDFHECPIWIALNAPEIIEVNE